MFSYQGSKRKELQQIADYEPDDCTTFVDVFGGGGSVFINYLRRDDYNYVVYNEISKPVFDIVSAIANGTHEELLTEIRDLLPSTNENRKSLIVSYDLFPTAAKYLALTTSGLRGMIHSTIKMRKINGVNVVDVRGLPNLGKYADDFVDGRYTLLCSDYRDILKQFIDVECAFVYLDPPYISRGTSNQNYGAICDDYLTHILSVMKSEKTKCQIMLNIDFTGHTYHMFKDFIKHTYQVSYNARSSKDGCYHLIACNY